MRFEFPTEQQRLTLTNYVYDITPHLLLHEDVEGHAEGDDEDHEDDHYFDQGLQNVQEHHHVDTDATNPDQIQEYTRKKKGFIIVFY